MPHNSKFTIMRKIIPITAAITFLFSGAADAQIRSGGLTAGGFGEIALSRNFFSDNVYRYPNAPAHEKEGHGRLEIPHVGFSIGYDFGKGWSMQSELEIADAGAGEAALEQFWIQKSFFPSLNIKGGHFIVPVGGLNNANDPMNYFTVYSPEGEFTILPSIWHDTGVTIWGEAGKWRYEVQLIAGPDAFLFSSDNFVKKGAGAPFEFKAADQCGIAARIDNSPIKSLNIGLSGYYGKSMHNAYPDDPGTERHAGVKGAATIGAFDFLYEDSRIIMRGSVDYGHIKHNRTAAGAPYDKSPAGRGTIACGMELGYDLFSLFEKLHTSGNRLFVFGRSEYYNPYIRNESQKIAEFAEKTRVAAGLNWFPIPEIAVKCEYSYRFLAAQYNNKPSISLGVAFQGFFTK